MVLPSALAVLSTQAFWALPSTTMVQVPQAPWLHPSLTEVRCRSSRKKRNRGFFSEVLTWHPLTVKV